MKLNMENNSLLFFCSQNVEDQKKYLIKRIIINRDISWDKIIIRSNIDGIMPFLYIHLKDQTDYVPAHIMKKLKRNYEQTFTMNLVFMRFLEELDGILSELKGPDIMVIKGASLLGVIYDDIGLRPMEDIDILVQRKDMEEVGNILKDLGFSKDPVYPTTYKRGPISVDLHTDILSSHRIESRQFLAETNNDALWKRSVLLFDKGSHVFRPSIEDTIIILSFHILKHNFERLIWLVDIAEILRKQALYFKWEDLLCIAKDTKAQRAIFYSIISVKNMFGLDVPFRFLKALSPRDMNFLEKIILRVIGSCEYRGRLPQLLYFFILDGWERRLKFFWENLFPSKEVINQCSSSRRINSTAGSYIRRLLNILFDILTDIMKTLRITIRSI